MKRRRDTAADEQNVGDVDDRSRPALFKTRVQCSRIESSESSITLRSRTNGTGSTMVEPTKSLPPPGAWDLAQVCR